MKNMGYKLNSRNQGVDWVIVSDCDELLYHPNLIEKLREYKEKGIDIPKIDGRNIVSDKFPTYDGRLITDILKVGSPSTYQPMCKNIVFNPEKLEGKNVSLRNILCNHKVFLGYFKLMLIMFCMASFNTSLPIWLHDTYSIKDEFIGPY
jgi:hypothetical protein